MRTLFQTAILCCFALLIGATATAQDKKARTSPMITVKTPLPGGEVTVQYSSPKVKGRTVWGELVPYGKVWRTGANEATTVTIPSDMKVEGSLLPAGKYALFTIPGEEEWEIIFNSVWDQWGAYNYDSSKDVLRFKVRAQKSKELMEDFTISVSENGTFVIGWEYVRVAFEMM